MKFKKKLLFKKWKEIIWFLLFTKKYKMKEKKENNLNRIKDR